MLTAVVMASLGLAGCDRGGQPAQDVRTPARLSSRYYPPSGWAWGSLTVEGAPPLRYGVAPAADAARGEVLILPGEGEPIEAWFETAGELTRRGYTVWAIDWAGQGGSGRWARTGDRAHLDSVDLDVAALRAMLSRVVRPKGRAALVLVGDGFGAQVGLRALSGGAAEAAGAVLAHPALAERSAGSFGPASGGAAVELAVKLGLAREGPFGERRWRHLLTRPESRAEVGRAWMEENPKLRIAGESWGWIAAYNRSARQAQARTVLASVRAPVLMLADPAREPAAERACRAMPACRLEPATGPAPHLALDAARNAWLDQVAGFVDGQAKGHALAAPPSP